MIPNLMPSSLLSLCCFLLGLCCPECQDAGSAPLPTSSSTGEPQAAASEAEPESATKTEASPTALAEDEEAAQRKARELAGHALLERAARYQSPEPRPRAPDSLHGVFYGSIRTPDGTGNVSVERWYTRAPERLLTRHSEAVTGSRQTIGWDGKRAWFRDDDSGEVVHYSDDAELFAVDLERLAEQRQLTRLLLDAIVLDALIVQLADVQAADETRWTDLEGRQHPVRHVLARLPDEIFPAPKLALPPGSVAPQRRLMLDLAIDLETGALWQVVITPEGRDDVSPLELRFDFHGRTRSGIMVPGNVRVLRAGETEEIIRLGVDFDQDDNLLLEIDSEIDPAIFSPPAG